MKLAVVVSLLITLVFSFLSFFAFAQPPLDHDIRCITSLAENVKCCFMVNRWGQFTPIGGCYELK